MSEVTNIKQFNAHPVKFGDIDDTFDEKGSTFLALRKVQWVKDGEDPDEDKAKFELRKYIIDKDGNERANKGFSFLTDEGPHELVKTLVHRGFGHTKDVLKELKHREDFKESVEHLNDEEDPGDGDYYDMRKLLEDDDEDYDAAEEED